jgi:F0F1-type ATP synthase assembly protein I
METPEPPNTPEETAKAAREKMDEVTEEFEDRLKAFEEKAGESARRRRADQAVKEEKFISDGKAAKGIGIGLTAAYAIMGTTMVGLGLGWLADRANGGNFWQGIGTIIGATAGVAFVVHLSNRHNT